MKKLLFLIMVSLVVFTSCKKDNTIYKTYFWTAMDSTKVSLELYIDGTSHGIITYRPQRPDCYNDTSFTNIKSVQLPVGSYHFQAKNKQGDVKFSSLVTIKNDGAVTATKTTGNIDLYGDYDWFCFGISY